MEKMMFSVVVVVMFQKPKAKGLLRFCGYQSRMIPATE
jgi:hypothetical protein